MTPLIHDDICYHCPIRCDKDFDKCKKTNSCRYVKSWFVVELLEQIQNMQVEINTLNSYIEDLVNP